jgi:hypothetical protein
MLKMSVSVSVRLGMRAEEGGKGVCEGAELLVLMGNETGSESRLGVIRLGVGVGVGVGRRKETEVRRGVCWVGKTEVSGVVAGVSTRLGLKWNPVR